MLAGGLLGAGLLVVAEFTTLFEVRFGTSSKAPQSIVTGSHHSYAMLVIALGTALLTYSVRRSGNRLALLGIGVLGLVALLIGLIGDFPDATATRIALVSGHYVEANATPSAGLYMETLGAVVLVITSACGFMLLGLPTPRSARRD